MNSLDVVSRDDPDPGRTSRSSTPEPVITTKKAERLNALTLDLIEDAILYGPKVAIQKMEGRVNGETPSVIRNIDALSSEYIKRLGYICKGIKDEFYVPTLRRNQISQPSAQQQ